MFISRSLFIAAVLTVPLASAQEDVSTRYYDAIRNDRSASLHDLIESGTGVKDRAGTTPLMYAAAVGSLASMQALIAAGAGVNAQNEFGATALMWCLTEEAKVRLLLEKGADVNAHSKQGRTPLLIASATDGNIEIVKLLLATGADLKKADASPIQTPLANAVTANDTAMVRLLLDEGADAHGPAGAFAMLDAAAHGNITVMRLLLGRGAPADTPSPPVVEKPVKNGDIALGLLRPLHFAVAFGGYDAVQFLLDRKADVNSQDVRGMTPLMLAIGVDHGDDRVVKLLLERGANPSIRSKTGENAVDWARKFNRPETLVALKLPARKLEVSYNSKPLPIRDAVTKSAELLQTMSAKFFVSSGCASCHAQNLTSMALDAAHKAGIKTTQDSADAERAHQTRTFWAARQQALLLRSDPPGGHNMLSYAVLQLASDGAEADAGIDGMIHNIAAEQQADGSWHRDGTARPPLADGDFTHTAIAIRSLALYGAPGRKDDFANRIARGASWLRRSSPTTTEDYNMQLLGLAWAGSESRELSRAASRIIALQRADGGWAQTPYLGADAYATGQSLIALKEAGVPASDTAYRKGIDFLLRTQATDGSWHVISRAPKFQPYFQSGFPYDHDQWISMAGTAWATMALSSALPASSAVAMK